VKRVGAIAAVLVLVGAGAMVLATKPGWYLRLLYPLRYGGVIVTHARNYGLPPTLVAAVIEQESKFRPDVRSSAGAVGLMQLTPETAKGIALRTGGHAFRQADLLDTEINIRYGCWYLRHLRQKYHGTNSYVEMLAAYNAGQGKVAQWIRDDDDHQLDVSEIPFAETRHYVQRVLTLQGYYARARPELSR
jgi:soluble lytic murein transglycosylase